MCIHIKRNSQYTSSMKAYPIWFSPCQIHIICNQQSFIIVTPTGIWSAKWTFIWHFWIWMNRIADFVKSLWYQKINISLFYRKIKLPMSRIIHRINESLGFSKASEPDGAYGLGTCVAPGHRQSPWQPVSKQFTSPKIIGMPMEEN